MKFYENWPGGGGGGGGGLEKKPFKGVDGRTTDGD